MEHENLLKEIKHLYGEWIEMEEDENRHEILIKILSYKLLEARKELIYSKKRIQTLESRERENASRIGSKYN